MSVALAPPPVFQAFLPSGQPLAGGQLFTYQAGTTTPQASFTDSIGLIPNLNPVILNASGQASVWLTSGQSYKLVLKDPAGNQMYSQDGIGGTSSFVSITVGPPASGSALIVDSAPLWAAITSNSTIQITGPNSLTNANQNVNVTQILLHGYAAETVGINGSATTDQKVWSDVCGSDGVRRFRLENDALNAGADWMRVSRSGSFSQDMAAITWPIGFGLVSIQTTNAVNQYQMNIFAGNVASFANGLHIGAGSNTSDHALTVVDYQNARNFFDIRGDGLIAFTGNVLFKAPTTGFSAEILGSTTAGVSKGLQFFAGTNASDFMIQGLNAANTKNLFSVAGDGSTTIGGGLGVNGNAAPSQSTGWGTPTGAAVLANFNGASATLPQATSVIAQLITILKSVGTLGN